jgi:site-specific DNA-methyltransferase (adenine-specific)
MDELGKIKLYNADCMDIMRQYPDKYFDLAVVDPPYGIGISNNPVRQMHKRKQWDKDIPKKEYFEELFRVSKNQIIWGGNYFINYLFNTQCFLIWDKVQPMDFSLAMCEFAWTSFKKPAKKFTLSVLQEHNKIHPTQKPIKLYEWIFKNYANKTDKVLDTHLGSGSSAIAAYNYGVDFTGIEIDEEFYTAAKKRLIQRQNELDLSF